MAETSTATLSNGDQRGRREGRKMIHVPCTEKYLLHLQAYCKQRRITPACYIDILIAEDMERHEYPAPPDRVMQRKQRKGGGK